MTSKLFQLIDFDRTLFDTTALIEAILEHIRLEDAALSDALRSESEAAYMQEQTFFLLRYLREHRGDEWLESLVGRIVRERGEDAFMLPGARERLIAADSLSTLRPSWGILTFGDPADQLLKIRLAGLEDAPIHIVTMAEKGGLIASWRQKNSTYRLPPELGGGAAEILSFEDDKLMAFADVPEGVACVWVTRREDAEQRLRESGLESSVALCRDLNESYQYIRAHLH